MNRWAVVVRSGSNLNVTLSSIYYDKWGAKTNQSVIIVDDWKSGADTASEKGYMYALFVDSGTVFTDWPTWKNLIDNYPHKGFIAHIIMRPGKNICIDPQCWFMDLGIEFDQTDTVSYPTPIRSEKDLHDSHTPLWVKPGPGSIHHTVDGFGQNLIAQQLNRGQSIVNWTPAARDIKRFLYKNSGLDLFQEYVDLAENQFWIFNNEPINIVDKQKIVCPGSGLFWIFNIISTNTQHIDIVDISDVQIKFCHDIWNHWDGSDYGSFVMDFINRNNIKHYELDKGDIAPIERLKLKNKSLLKQYVDDKFRYLVDQIGVGDDFQSLWQQSKSTKSISIQKGNLVDWVLENHDLENEDHIWTSNILDYKWTLLHTSYEKSQQFRGTIK